MFSRVRHFPNSRGSLGPFRARRIQQSLPERAFIMAFRLFRSRPRALGPFGARRIQQSQWRLGFSGAAAELWDLFARAASNRAFQTERLVAFRLFRKSSGAAELWDFFARAASNRAFQRERLVAFTLFRSRPRALGLFRARRIQQSLVAFTLFRSRPRWSVRE